MKKIIKKILFVYFISLLLMGFGVSGSSFSGFSNPLKALKGETNEGTLTKGEDYQPQILKFGTVDNNRNLDFKINDSTWQYVSSPSNKLIEIDGGMIQYPISLYPGSKTLKMRTHGYYIGVTGLNGSWWMSKEEYYRYN